MPRIFYFFLLNLYVSILDPYATQASATSKKELLQEFEATFSRDVETAKQELFKPACSILIHVTSETLSKWQLKGSGILISKPKEQEAFGVLTAAHIIQSILTDAATNKDSYIEIFAKFSHSKTLFPLKEICYYCYKDEPESPLVDIALCQIVREQCDDLTKHVTPAHLWEKELTAKDLTFGQYAGYGDFVDLLATKPFKDCTQPGFPEETKKININYPKSDTPVSLIYTLGSTIQNHKKMAHRGLYEPMKNANKINISGLFFVFQTMKTKACLEDSIFETVTGMPPRKPCVAGFSGSGILNYAGKVIGIATSQKQIYACCPDLSEETQELLRNAGKKWQLLANLYPQNVEAFLNTMDGGIAIYPYISKIYKQLDVWYEQHSASLDRNASDDSQPAAKRYAPKLEETSFLEDTIEIFLENPTPYTFEEESEYSSGYSPHYSSPNSSD